MITQIETTEVVPNQNLIVSYVGGEAPTLAGIKDASLREAAEAALKTLAAKTTEESITRIVSPTNASLQIIAVGVGEDPSADVLRRAAGAGVRAAAGLDAVTVAFAHETVGELEAICEGALLGAYAFTAYKTAKNAPVSEITVLSDVPEANVVAERASVIAEATNVVRDLVNTAPNELNPESFARIAQDAAAEAGCSVTVWDWDGIEAEGLEGLRSVGQGSAEGARLVRVEWAPADAQAHVALVGKGITYDSGGLSLKMKNGMVSMKTDMTGAATVLEATVAAARLQIPVRVTAWLCLAENMPSGTATRPDDVIVYRNGLSVEINNTDAEGRLVLADGLIMATEEKPDVVVDIATLTGAQMMALGHRTSGVMGTDDVRDAVVAAADSCGEAAWGMPLPDELATTLDSDIADMKNSGYAMGGGMLVAAHFLKKFVGETPWAHIDIAGPSFNREGAWGYTPKGGTGCMLRTLVAFVESVEPRETADAAE